MKKGEKTVKIGFTLIEVSLVLGIAGLIILAFTIALPALQRQARDAQRKESVEKLVSEIKNFQSNNRGAFPTNDPKPTWMSTRWSDTQNGGDPWDTFYQEYLGDNFRDPDGTKYYLVINRCDASVVDRECAAPDTITVAGAGNIAMPKNAIFPNGHAMFVILGGKCYGNKVVASSNSRKAAVLYALESGGAVCDEV